MATMEPTTPELEDNILEILSSSQWLRIVNKQEELLMFSPPALPIVRDPVYFCSSVLSPAHLGTRARASGPRGPRLPAGGGGGGGGGGKGRGGRLERLGRHTPLWVWRKAWPGQDNF